MRKGANVIWCKGCGLYSVFNSVNKILAKEKNVFAVSGIGCSGRAAGYFDFDSVNTLHGRAIPIAEGLKRANKKLNVFVMSGDGDLLGIGLNHLIHCARRNTDITVICMNNHIYGMTGGQASPTTGKGVITKTSPNGNEFEPINAQGILMSNKKYFYARTNPYNPKHLHSCLEKAFAHKGFSFVEVSGVCHTNVKRILKIKNMKEIIKPYVENISYVEENRVLEDNEYGVNFK